MLRRIVCLVMFLMVACLAFGDGPKPDAPPAQPAITKPELEVKLDELKRAQQQAMADYNAIGGAIQDCQYWIDQITAKETEAKAKKKQVKVGKFDSVKDKEEKKHGD